ncbi:hypothetical protein [Aurantiacibacter xanthus]|uniref:hypothetical protein n=1 Tax=Aurantiacibacter xanthus TaxID=1784712 RepID=UPI00174C6A8B|nr:hypothetical protein [Aurantiacibacter xanthus]
MDYRQWSAEGLRVPLLCFGAAIEGRPGSALPYPNAPYRCQEEFTRLNPVMV